jgi:hypothetical protein
MVNEIHTLRMVEVDDYPVLYHWWEMHGFPPVPQRLLPPLGVICDENAAGWLYMDNGGTGVAMMEWLVTNPEASPRKAIRALQEVVAFLKSEAKRMEYPFILTTCRQDALARLLEKCGFTISDRDMTHLMGVFP